MKSKLIDDGYNIIATKQSLEMLRSHNEELETVGSDLLCSEAHASEEARETDQSLTTRRTFSPVPAAKGAQV